MAEIKMTSSGPAGKVAASAKVVVSTSGKRVLLAPFMLPKPVPASPRQ